jgi:hypothetical protein
MFIFPSPNITIIVARSVISFNYTSTILVNRISIIIEGIIVTKFTTDINFIMVVVNDIINLKVMVDY